jgi:hypothetical protein
LEASRKLRRAGRQKVLLAARVGSEGGKAVTNIECRRYEKPLKNGWYIARKVYRVTDDEVLYTFDTEDGYQVGVSTPKQFRRWMKGTLPKEGSNV